MAKRKGAIGQKAFHVLELPPGVLSDTAHIELIGDKEASIEGVKGVIAYEPNEVKLNIGQKILRFTGLNLCLKCLTDESAIVVGEIKSLEFLM